MINKANNKIKEVLTTLVAMIPDTLYGTERQKYIGNLLDKQPEATKVFLRDVLLKYILKMRSLNASDFDMGGAGCKGNVWYRIHGEKKPDMLTSSWSLDESDILLQNILMFEQRKHLYENRFVDFSFQALLAEDSLRFRATLYFEMNNLGLNMRLIDAKVRPLKELLLHSEVIKVLSFKHVKSGLILVTGITGAGKSSTLDSIIDATNRVMNTHIVIISDPVEYVHTPKKSIVRHREVGMDVKSFKDGTIQALRQDPDIIVIGEMRDPDTISTVLEVADSGHKVFSTLHTSSARESIDRIVGEADPVEQERLRSRLADVLVCVISQKLIPSLDGKRVLAKEVLLATSPVKTAIRNNNTEEIYQMIYQSGNSGMNTLEQDLARLCKEKKISPEEAYNYANNKKRLEELIKL